MRIIQCRQLRPQLTAYVDNEMSGLERRRVEDHLARCESCRRRMRREAAVRQRFQRWSAESREAGTPLSWPAASAVSNPHRLGTLLRLTVVSAVTITLVLLSWNHRWGFDVGVPLAAQGRIGGSLCAWGHQHKSGEMKDLNGRECVRLCVMTGAEYVFISGGTVYSIRNQDFGALTRFAGQDVQVEGDVREHMLTVKRVRPLGVKQ
jgi:hypothetical protein